MEDTLIWRSSSRAHDWRTGAFLAHLLDAAAGEGLIGPTEWLERRLAGSRKAQRIEPGALAERLMSTAEPSVRVLAAAGGSDPHPWSVSAVVFPWDDARGRAEGYSIITLELDRAAGEGQAGSRRLRDAFLHAHDAGNTEAAYLHSFKRWDVLAAEVYLPPLVTVPTFAGVFWANFLGPGHLDQFDASRLGDLSASTVKWVDGGRGLFIIATGEVAQSETAEGEAELRRLTEEMRAALRPE